MPPSNVSGGGIDADVSRSEEVHGLIGWSIYEREGQGGKEVARTFSIDTTASPTSLLARRAASENGAALVGNETTGRFSHEMVKGEYRIIGRTVVVTVTNKHWLLPWPVVQAHLRKLVGSA